MDSFFFSFYFGSFEKNSFFLSEDFVSFFSKKLVIVVLFEEPNRFFLLFSSFSSLGGYNFSDEFVFMIFKPDLLS